MFIVQRTSLLQTQTQTSFKNKHKHISSPKMAHWSAENATRAYLSTIKMGKRGKEPDVAEFISALAGGNNAKLMVEVCGSTAGPTTLGLVAAAQQTGGRVVCILPGPIEVQESKSKLSCYMNNNVEFVTGDKLNLLSNIYKAADFVTLDCNVDNHKTIFKSAKKGGALVVGYNAHHLVSSCNELRGHFLPIREGLLVSNVVKVNHHGARGSYIGNGLNTKSRSRWVTKIDRFTGEEHVFRVTCPRQKVIQA